LAALTLPSLTWWVRRPSLALRATLTPSAPREGCISSHADNGLRRPLPG